MFKNSILFLSFFVFASSFSQTNLKAYKYIIVPNKYDFLNKIDQYQLNSISEFLFNKHGFIALKEDAKFPEDLINDRCLALNSNVLKDKSLFKTKLSIVLKDCNDKKVYTSKIGESREKEYRIAYNQALRDAFKSFSTLNHKYTPKQSNAVTVDKKSQPLRIEPNLKGNKSTVVKEAKTNSVSITNSNSNSSSNVLYAQTMANGFQLVDSTPRVVYKLLKTKLDNVFLVEGKEAIIYEANTKWILELYENGVLKQDILNIKF